MICATLIYRDRSENGRRPTLEIEWFMRLVQAFGATGAPPPVILQTSALRRRVAASDSVALLLAALAYGEPRRCDVATLANVTSARVASYTDAHS